MDFGSTLSIVSIGLVCTGGWLINNWIRARHGYALEDEWGGKTVQAETDSTRALRAENADLREQLAHFADRVKVLERIATDDRQSRSIAAEIESLRDK